jgi:hypothetical protein
MASVFRCSEFRVAENILREYFSCKGEQEGGKNIKTRAILKLLWQRREQEMLWKDWNKKCWNNPKGTVLKHSPARKESGHLPSLSHSPPLRVILVEEAGRRLYSPLQGEHGVVTSSSCLN